MRTAMYLTIQDYFKRANIKGLSAAQSRPCQESSKANRAHFSDALNTAQASLDGRRQSLSISDYFKNPVRSRHFSTTPLSATPQPSKSTPFVAKPAPPGQEPIPSSAAATSVNVSSKTALEQDKEVIQASIRKAATKYNLPPALLQAVVKAESNYQVRAVSPAGAQGLMQLMPGTARELGVNDPFDIQQNINGGAQYLRSMLTRFNGDLKQALSAYNAGPGTVAKYNGHVPYPETRTYVARVLRYTDQFSGVSNRST